VEAPVRRRIPGRHRILIMLCRKPPSAIVSDVEQEPHTRC
jgi:hypothetical protein